MIDFSNRAPARNTARANTTAADRPAAQVWLNVGFYAGEGENQKFVSLPQGIPLDTMEPIRVSSTNEDFRNFQSARNDLLAQIMAAAAELEPGQEDVLNLQIQIRRVAADVATPSAETNPYSSGLAGHQLVGAIAG